MGHCHHRPSPPDIWAEHLEQILLQNSVCLEIHWVPVYSIGMGDFTREDILAKIAS